MPHREVLDGVLVIFGGAFLITPGFITDIVGLLLLVPPTRAVSGGSWPAGSAGAWRWAWWAHPRRRSHYDVEGTATEYDAPARRLER